MRRGTFTRRQALAHSASLAAASPLWQSANLRAQKLAGEAPGRIPPVLDLLNAAEFEAVAERKLDSLTFAEISGGDMSRPCTCTQASPLGEAMMR